MLYFIDTAGNDFLVWWLVSSTRVALYQKVDHLFGVIAKLWERRFLRYSCYLPTEGQTKSIGSLDDPGKENVFWEVILNTCFCQLISQNSII